MKKIVVILLMTLLAIVPAYVSAAAYLKFDGVDGESKDEAHKDWIDVLNWSFSIRNEGKKDACTAGLRITKLVDRSSAAFVQSAADRTRMGSKGNALLVVTSDRDTSTEYLEYSLENTMVAGYQIRGGSEGRPKESIILKFDWIGGAYRFQNSDGSTGLTEFALEPRQCKKGSTRD